MAGLYDSTATYDVASTSYDGGLAASFGLPNVGVFIAFNSTPYEAEPLWEEVTDYVRQIPSIRRARNDDWSAFTGSAFVVLSNRDQRFNPYNTSSPLNGLLKPRKQIKIVAVMGEYQYSLFRGYIAGWPVDWTDQGLDSTVTIECFDALALLASEQLKEPADTYIRSLSPRHYWPATDPINPLSFASQTLVDYGSSPQPLRPFDLTIRTSNSGGLAEGLANSCVNVAETEFVNSWRYTSTALAATDTTYSLWFVQGLSEANWAIFVGGTSSTAEAYYDRSTSTLTISTYNGSTQRNYTATVYMDTTQPHHMAVGITSTATLSYLYLDGRAVTMALASSGAFATTVTEEFDFTSGKKQQCAVWTRLLTATEIETIYGLSRGFIQETSAARMNRLVAGTSFPTALISSPSSPEGTVLAISADEPSLASELNLLRNSEGGELYTSKDGVVTLTNRNSQLKGRSATTQATFKEDGTALEYADTFSLGYDADSIVNDLRVSITGDAQVLATDTASLALYGRKTQSLETQLATVADAQVLGDSKVAIFGDPIPTVSPLQVGTTRVAADWQSLLALELLDQIEVTRTPTTGTVFSDRLLINEISHTINLDSWSMSITGSARYSEWFTIDVDYIDGSRLIA